MTRVEIRHAACAAKRVAEAAYDVADAIATDRLDEAEYLITEVEERTTKIRAMIRELKQKDIW